MPSSSTDLSARPLLVAPETTKYPTQVQRNIPPPRSSPEQACEGAQKGVRDPMKPFRVTGHFEMGHNRKQPFTKQFAAEDEERVRERVLSELGSRHAVTRRQITITDVSVITDEEELDPIVRHIIEKSGA